MSHVYWLVIPPMFPVLMSVFSLNYTEAGAIITAFATATTIAQTPVGFLVDKMGARTVLIGGLALEGLAIGLFGFSTAYWQFLGIRYFIRRITRFCPPGSAKNAWGERFPSIRRPVISDLRLHRFS
jgi:MFS family permease